MIYEEAYTLANLKASHKARLCDFNELAGQINLITPQLFDTAELSSPFDNASFTADARAAIVEQYNDHYFELEFVNDAGDDV